MRIPIFQYGEEFSEGNYNEKDTMVGAFFNNYKWIRYTYDFGDDWRHKINIEKKDDAYDKRYATLLKFKGNNFMEDSGGIWYGENQETEEYNGGVFMKAVGMGLADVVDKGNAVGIFFASDVSRFVGNANSKIRARIYNNLEKFDERLGSLIKVYGIIELESLYEMYKHYINSDRGN